MAATVYTLTANLLAETTAYYEDLVPGRTHRARCEEFQVGGKGINVSRIVHLLGRPTHALYFPGGLAGARCTVWIESLPFPSTPFPVSAETRQGWVVRLPDRPETTFLGADRPIEPEVWRGALRFLKENLRSGDALALCGSMPGWNADLSDEFNAVFGQIGARSAISVDTYGPPLDALSGLPLLLAKVNRSELETLVGPVVTEAALPELLSQLGAARPVRNWVVTNGAERIWARDAGARVFPIAPPAVREVSPTGCGDVLHAAILDGLLAGMNLEEALRRAVPLASASAARRGIADLDPGEIPLLPESALRIPGSAGRD